MTTPTTPSASRQITRAAGTVMIAIVASNLIGLLKTIIEAHHFGTGTDLEAFKAANRVTETLFNLMAGGALASAFIPTFTGMLVKDLKKDAWQLASAIANLLIVILISVSVLAMIFAPWVVSNLLAIGFSPEQKDLTVQILRVLLPSVVIFGLSGLVMGILNSHQKFFVPALTPSMYSIGMIAGILFLSPSMGIFGYAWGAVLGAALHLLFQLPTLFRLRGTYSPTLGLHNPHVVEVGWLMLPRLFGAGIVQLNFWVNTLLCTFTSASVAEGIFGRQILTAWLSRLSFPFEQGSLPGLTYAFSLMLMPQAAIAQSIAIASMPTFSAQASLDQFDELRSTLASSLRGMLLLAVPASIGLMMLRIPVVALLFQRGNFSLDSTELVAWPLLWYAAGLVGHSMVEVLSRAFYALHDTKTPVLIGAAAMTLNIIFSMLFSVLFTRLGWMPHGGLALANSFATALEMVGLLFLLRRRLVRMEGKRIFQIVWQAGLAGGCMALFLWGWLYLTASLSVWIQALGGIAIGGLIYLGLMAILRVPELFNLYAVLLRRLIRR